MSEHSMVALGMRSKEVRTAAARLRGEIATRQITIAEALMDERAGVLTVQRLLTAQSYWGPLRVSRALRGTFVRPDRRVRDLTDNQKTLIVVACSR